MALKHRGSEKTRREVWLCLRFVPDSWWNFRRVLTASFSSVNSIPCLPNRAISVDCSTCMAWSFANIPSVWRTIKNNSWSVCVGVMTMSVHIRILTSTQLYLGTTASLLDAEVHWMIELGGKRSILVYRRYKNIIVRRRACHVFRTFIQSPKARLEWPCKIL